MKMTQFVIKRPNYRRGHKINDKRDPDTQAETNCLKFNEEVTIEIR